MRGEDLEATLLLARELPRRRLRATSHFRELVRRMNLPLID